VLYDGTRSQPAHQIVKLSDSYAVKSGRIKMDAEVEVFNIARMDELPDLQRCQYLCQYHTFMERIDENKKTMPPNAAVQKAIKDCIADGIMADYLSRKEREVFDMLSYEWNEDEERAAWEKKCAMEREIERNNARLDAIRNLMANLHITAEKAMEAMGIPATEQHTYLALL